MGNNPNIKFLDEKVFRPFFEADHRNKILLFKNFLIDCDDCRSHWIVNETNYLKRFDFLPLKCLDGKSIEISNNFKNCK
jgi:elongation factor P hydroxylase